MSATVQYALFAFLPVMLVYAAFSDLLTMTIPNRVTLLIGGAFVVMAPLTGMDMATFGLHLAAGALMLTISFGLFAAGWIGGGDAKLAAAIALWFGWSMHTVEFVAIASIFGGLLTFIILGFRNMPVPAFASMPGWVKRLHDSKTGVPYGIALSAGALAVYGQTVWVSLLAA